MTKEETVTDALRGEGCLGRSASDEPVFVLCARDRFSSTAIRRWADMVESATHPDSPGRNKAEAARRLAREFDEWRDAHGGGKVPD